MEEEEGGGGPRLSKRFSDKVGGGAVGTGEVDYKTKSGTAWSHNYLNQKPWHPLSYPNQRRKWIAEQTHAQRDRRAEEVAREFAQEQEFFRQTALVSKKEKEKMETMKAVSFMYVRPPGYNAESAKAAEIADEKKISDQSAAAAPHPTTATLPMPESRRSTSEDKKKTRPKDVFGRALPTEEEFEVLKNAPRLETGAPARVKPFAVEIRNVRCVRCGTYGHQSGDRECPMKDTIMPSDESRLKRDDPLTAMTAQTDSSEPLKWELKQRPGISPPRGGFRPDDPNQQIVAEDIFDEYGGFLSGGDIPSLLTNFKEKKTKKHSGKKSKHKRHSSSSAQKYKVHDDIYLLASSDTDVEKERRSKHKHREQHNQHSDTSESSDYDRHHDSRRQHESKSMERQHESKRLSPSFDCDGSNKWKISKRKHYERHSESERLPSSSDFDSSNKRRMSKSKENEKRHVSERLAPSSDSDSSSVRKITKSRYKKGRQQHDSKRLSVYSDSDGGSVRKISKRKHNLHKKERHDSSRRDTCDESDSGHHRRRRKHHHH